jgi:hypothetical protein
VERITNAATGPALLTPSAEGWLLRCGDDPAQNVATLAEAAAALLPGLPVHLALPCQALIIERLNLPATQREELVGMVRLQSEKALPFPIDEVSIDFVNIATGPQESTVLAVSAPHATLETLCQPLRERGIVLERLTPFVLHVAAACPADETVLAIYAEQGECVVAIAEAGQLSWTHVLAATDADRLTAALPQLLLPAIMEGVATTFSRVLLARDCWDLEPALREFFELPVDPLPPAATMLAAPINLAPDSWQAQENEVRRARNRRQQLLIAAALYLLAAAGVIFYLATLERKAANLDAQFAAVRPKLELIQKRKVRSNALAAAVDPNRYTVELLYLVLRGLPTDEVRITEFDETPDQWRLVGEAPSANLAIDYVARIKEDKDLAAYQINAPPPQLLPNEHAQFNIFGKR